MDDETEGRCVSCGFLAKHCPGIHTPTPNFFEMDAPARKTGNAFQHTIDTLAGLRDSYPVCFREVPESIIELKPLENTKDAKALIDVIRRERSCKLWCEYMPGFSPREHFIYMKFAELEEDRRQFELQLDQMAQASAAQHARANRNIQIFFGVVAAFLAIVAGSITLLQVAFPNGWPWLMEKAGSLPPPVSIPSIPGF